MLPKLYGYSSAICKYAEGKLLQNNSNVGLLANNIAAYEKEIDSHDQSLYQLWDMIVNLSKFYHAKEKPTLLDSLKLMWSSKDKKTSVSDTLQTNIAKANCLHLEQKLRDDFLGSVSPSASVNEELVRVLDQNACEIIQQVKNVSEQDYSRLRSALYLDQNSQTFPFMTILIFLRAGLETYISHFCSNSSSQEVLSFGELFKKYSAANSKLSLS
jgi:hypothetical protein